MKTFKYFKSINILSIDKVMRMKIVAQVQKLGRIVIPKTYRDFYNIQEGDILEFEVLRIKRQDGMIINFSQQAQEAVSNGQ